MLSGVLDVIESVSSAIMSIRFQFGTRGPKLANIAPPHPVFNKMTLGYNRNCQQFPRILGHYDAFFSHSV